METSINNIDRNTTKSILYVIKSIIVKIRKIKIIKFKVKHNLLLVLLFRIYFFRYENKV